MSGTFSAPESIGVHIDHTTVKAPIGSGASWQEAARGDDHAPPLTSAAGIFRAAVVLYTAPKSSEAHRAACPDSESYRMSYSYYCM